jgi:dTMP kinase
MNRGRLITLEGGEGAGKSTLLEGLLAHLHGRGIDAQRFREPGGTPLGEAVRAILLDHQYRGMCAESELLLMFASRAELVRKVIRPALADGRWVLCDRFTDASYAYQGGGRGQPVERIRELETWAALDLQPDLTFLLELSVVEGRARRSGRGGADRIENEDDAFFERVHAAYRARAAASPQRIRVLDASAPAAAVLAAACAALGPLLERHDS